MPSRTILYVFAGRRENLEIALPYYRDILNRNPDTEVHIWDLSQRDRTGANHRYLASIETSDRLKVRTEFYGNFSTSRGQALVWKHYGESRYADCTFVKIDDDVLFLDTKNFKEFVRRARRRPDVVTSALTINNGASTELIPALRDGYRKLDIPLLDVHLSADYAEMCHRWFLDNWRDVVDQPGKVQAADSWLSINCIAYSHAVGRTIGDLIGQLSPETIAGREFPRVANGRRVYPKIGDEGAVNMQRVAIDTGFTVSHFGFGPQVNLNRTDGPVLSAETQAELRAAYAALAEVYLHHSEHVHVAGA
ncbi:hypothetical protein LT350_33760 [Mycolicibacterium smegmatis]|uniref:hypothetical protein n=1 Tax=Mycolicibacterium smegmatis TaxID=1772 RepID=UPI001E3DE46C|nr:hypothetical protein [Mycolicibacterium smegmatis]UGU31390.1 hypothetical protein LT350_33760 [Mycolicibacterium smegmatis]ULN72284.1 hypothetical protein KZ782_10505 [Mycolicibacterium smegmatis]